MSTAKQPRPKHRIDETSICRNISFQISDSEPGLVLVKIQNGDIGTALVECGDDIDAIKSAMKALISEL